MMKMFHVRWPGETGGAIGFALNFWFFWFKPKEHNRCNILSFVTSDRYKKKSALPLIALFVMLSCRINNGNISIKHSLHDDYYEMTAKYDPGKKGEVVWFPEKELFIVDMSFMNTKLNKDITLD